MFFDVLTRTKIAGPLIRVADGQLRVTPHSNAKSLQYRAPRSWTERAYPNLIYFNEVDKGGHFAAWEQPELFASEMRAGFRPLR
jgi:pimeloyl-ACP methyl ester carboxylesterase